MHFLYKADFNDQGKVRKFLYEILPRYISSFISCTGSVDSVRIMLAERETKAWNSFGGMILEQDLAYVFCQDLLAARLTSAKDLNLCEVCDQHTVGHPPGTCHMVTPKLSQMFSTARAKNDLCRENDKLAFERSPQKIGIVKIKVEKIDSN